MNSPAVLGGMFIVPDVNVRASVQIINDFGRQLNINHLSSEVG